MFCCHRIVAHCDACSPAEGTQYDAFNRLIVVGDAESSDTIATYTYDALGRRIRKVIADLGSGMGGLTGDILAGTTDYLYDGQQIIEDRNGSNTAVAQYVWGMYIDELVQMKEPQNGTGPITPLSNPPAGDQAPTP
jgi:YD repeat-containing protein